MLNESGMVGDEDEEGPTCQWPSNPANGLVSLPIAYQPCQWPWAFWHGSRRKRSTRPNVLVRLISAVTVALISSGPLHNIWWLSTYAPFLPSVVCKKNVVRTQFGVGAVLKGRTKSIFLTSEYKKNLALTERAKSCRGGVRGGGATAGWAWDQREGGLQ